MRGDPLRPLVCHKMPNTPLLVLLDSTASTLAIGNQAQTVPEPGSEAYVLGYMSAR